MSKDGITSEHYQSHTITEIEHFPEHEKRHETKTFINARKELENVEHLGCFVCDSMDKREDHHIFERAYWNALDLKRVAFFLFNHFDFHGHNHRDFKSADELYDYLSKLAPDDQPDVIYNQLILCKDHHRGEGTGIHGMTGPTFFAWLAHKSGFDISYSPKEYDEHGHKREAK